MNTYRRELDGLRAFAVIPVVLFHIAPTLMPGGFLGVDVFFVLSGYLISGRILPEILQTENAAAFRFTQFYLRRLKRLVPAVLVLITILQCMGFFLLLNTEWLDLSSQSLAAVLAVGNMYFWWHTGDYWGPAAETMPLLHTWSLGIEEQFYLAFPFLLMMVTKLSTSWSVRIGMLATIAACSFFGFVYARRTYPDAGFYWAPLRAWELLAGCVLAVHQRNERGREYTGQGYRFIPAAAGLALILYGYITGWGISVITWRSAIITVVGTGLTISYSSVNKCPVRRLLSLPPLMFIGVISYSLYLWHWPVIVFFTYAGLASVWYVIPAALFLSLLSYALVERPARNCGNRTFLVIFICLLAVTAGSMLLPLVSHRPARHFRAPQFHDEISLHPANAVPRFGEFTGTWRTGLSLFNPNHFSSKAVIFGDSHSVMYFPAIREACERLKLPLTFFGASNATSPFFVENRSAGEGYGMDWEIGQRVAFDVARIQFLQKHQPRVVFICARWSQYSPICHVWSEDRFIRHLNKLREACGSSICVFVGQPPELPIAQDLASGKLEEPFLRVYEERQLIATARRQIHGIIKSFCEVRQNCHFIDIEDIFTRKGLPILFDGSICLYRDDDHLSIEGAKRTTLRIASFLKDLHTQPEN